MARVRPPGSAGLAIVTPISDAAGHGPEAEATAARLRERGWSAVIGGATMLSAGFVIAAIAAVLVRLDEIARALAAVRSPTDAPASPEPAPTPVRPGPTPPAVSAAERSHEADGERQIVGRHVSGDSTYVMFSDGTVEAHTPDGVLHFASLDELRAYADERDAANPGRS